MYRFLAKVAFNTSKNGQTDNSIQHDNDENLAQSNVRASVFRSLLPRGDSPFVAVLEATYADNLHIVLSCPQYKAFILILTGYLLCVWICFLEREQLLKATYAENLHIVFVLPTVKRVHIYVNFLCVWICFLER